MLNGDWDLISSYVGLLCLACGSIYAGAFDSLPYSQLSKKANECQDTYDEDATERMSSEDAWLFPIFGSVALLGMFLLLKYAGTEWVNLVLGYYFSVTGVLSVCKSLISLAKFLSGRTRWKEFEVWKFVIEKGDRNIVDFSWRTPEMLCLPLGAAPSILYNVMGAGRKSILVTNILSLSFSQNALSLLKLDSFKTGIILLSGLFVYDIWWVFGTKVMVTVATSLDVPIKLLWPKSMMFSSSRGYTMLGLGDVIVPGTFIALALRYDHFRSERSLTSAFHKPYFYSIFAAYIMGLITTISVMHVFQAAQPALLYLSPACIISLFMTAIVRGEVKDMWSWSDNPTDEQQPADGGQPDVVSTEEDKRRAISHDAQSANEDERKEL